MHGSVGGLLLALGQYGILHRLFYRFVPLFRLTRAPARAGFLFVLAISAACGLLCTSLQGSVEDRRRLLRSLPWPLMWKLAAGAVLVVVAGFMAYAMGRDVNPAAGRLWHVANRVALFLLWFLLASALLIGWRQSSGRRAKLFPSLALGLVLLDLWTFGNGIVRLAPVAESDYWRVVSSVVADVGDELPSGRVLPWGLSEFAQNDGMSFGLRSVFGYDPLVLQRYETFVSSRTDPLARTYDLLNARYLVTTAPQDVGDDAPALRLLKEEAGVWVYERLGALPSAWVVPEVASASADDILDRIHSPDFDPQAVAYVEDPLECAATALDTSGGGQVDITEYASNRVAARVRGDGGLLVFSDVYYPGWRATVDGVSAELVRADYILRGVCVPAGEHQVMLVYDPPLLKAGAIGTALALLVVALAGGLAWRRTKRRYAA